MATLEERLQQPPGHLSEFFHNAKDALIYLRETTATHATPPDYSIYKTAQNLLLRPIRNSLFLSDPDEFLAEANSLCDKLAGIISSRSAAHGPLVDRVLYTAAQAHACVFDAELSDGAARKSYGVVFATMIRNVLRAGGIDTQALTLALSTGANCPIDIVANRQRVRSTKNSLAEEDFVASCMTTTKDRLARTFADKLLLERYYKHPIRLAIIALHDVQRKGTQDVTSTFLPNVFLLNWNHLAHLEGLYYLDVPATATGELFHGKVRPFHQLLLSFPA